MSIHTLKNTLTKDIPGEGRAVVCEWIDIAHEQNNYRRMKCIFSMLDEWRRINNHQNYAVWWAIKKLKSGRTFEDVAKSWDGDGNYFVSIGIGPGFLDSDENIHRETIGVKIYGLGIKTFNGRNIFTEAKRVIEQKNK